MRLVIGCVLLLGFVADLPAQEPAPVAQTMRDHARRFTDKAIAAAEAMPSELYTYRPTAGERVFADLLVIAANASDYLCGRIAGARPSGHTAVQVDSPRAELLKRLRETKAFCTRSLQTLDDAGMAEVIQAPAARSRAAAVGDAIATWADLGARFDLYFRMNGRVPPRPCYGVYSDVDCGSGVNLCRQKPPVPLSTAELRDGPFSVRSDGRGIYRAGPRSGVFAVASRAAVFGFLAQPRGRPVRKITIDLNRPVNGDKGVPLGVISDSMHLEIAAQWGSDSSHQSLNVVDIPIGGTVSAAQLDLEFHIHGVVHVLQMGPQPSGHCFSDRTAIHGTGTTQGTISRPDSTTWIVDLPVGSIGRLFDVHLSYPSAIDKGLYHVSLQLVLRR